MALALGLPAGVRGASVSASLDRMVANLGETLTLTLTFEGVQVQGYPTLPQIPNFQVDPSFNSSGFSFGPGGVRQTFQYQLIPTREGDLVIPAMQFRAGNQTLTTTPLTVKVGRAAAPGPGGTNLPSVFLRLEVPKTNLYVGELTPIEVRLYAQEGQLVEPPKVNGDGFTITRMADPTQSQTRVGNQRYTLVTFRAALLPVRPSSITLGPATMPFLVTDRTRVRRGLFDSFFFDNFAPQTRINLASEPVVVEVLPLPRHNVPPSFNGAVGSFTLQVTAAPTNVNVGDPVTIHVRLSGRGHLEALTLPAQADWREFKIMPGDSKVDSSDPLGISGVKTFLQVVLPQNHEVRALPPFHFSFFDPDLKTYRTVSSPAIPLHVQMAAPAGPLPVLAGLSNRADRVEAATNYWMLKAHLGALTPAQPLLFQRGWFLALQLLPPALWLGLLARRRYAETLSRNPRLRRRRQVARLVRHGLADLRRLAAQGNSDAFHATLFRLLQEQIGERLDTSASAITEAVIEERLRPLGLADDSAALLHELFQQCNLARYAPVGGPAQLDALVPKAEAALATVQKLPDPGSQ